MIEDLCKRLRAKRLEKGYNIETVVKQTKLHPSVIKDIENCNFGSITPIYIKGFIKIYASFLGVEIGNELEEAEGSEVSGRKKSKKRKDGRPKKENKIFAFFQAIANSLSQISAQTIRNVFIVGAILVFLWLGFLGVRFSFRKMLAFFRGRAQVEEKLSPEEAKDFPARLERGIEQIRASLTARKPCYVRAFVDGDIMFEGVLNEGEIKSWRAQERLELRISDGSAVYLEVDGESIPRLSSLRRRKNVIIDSSGIRIE